MTKRSCAFLLLCLLAPLSFGATIENKAAGHRQVLAQIETPPLSNASWGILAIELSTGEVLLERNASRLFIPASNRKLFTTAFALDRLGGDHRFQTRIYRRGNLSGGTLYGDLIVRASGDPSLSLADFENLASQICAAGIRSVTGGLIVDVSCFSELNNRGEGWSSRYISEGYVAPLTAFAVNQNQVRITASPSGRATVSPSGSSLTVLNRARIVSKGSSGVDVRQGSDGNTLIVEGQLVRSGQSEVISASVPNPNPFTAEIFKKALRNRGISVSGSVKITRTPVIGEGLSLIASCQSPPLSQLIRTVNQDSDNFMAEMIYLAAGRGKTQQPASYELSRREEIGFWQRCRLTDAMILHAADGSGLSRHNQFTPRSFCELMRRMLAHPEREAFTSSLAVSGKSGKLKMRMDEPEYRNRVLAKTGFISGVSCLSGYVIDRANQTRIFSVLANDFTGSTTPMKSMQDRVCRHLIDSPDFVETAMRD